MRRDRPRNANQLPEHLDLDYDTVRYHFDRLTDHDRLESSGDADGQVALPTDRFWDHAAAFERITDRPAGLPWPTRRRPCSSPAPCRR